METWGELFWDAWIRLRLSFRRLYRAYWPPQFKAWQVCTFTGIASIILTLVVLNLPSSKTELQAKNEKPAKGGKTKLPTKLVATAEDPFANVDSTASDLVDDAAPPAQAEAQTEPMEFDEGPPVAKKHKQTEVALNDLPATDDVFEGKTAEEGSTDERPTLPPAATDAADVPTGTDEAATSTEQPVAQPEDPPFTPTEAAPPENQGRITFDPKGFDVGTTPEPEATQPPAKQHTPFKTPIRSNSHYSRLGSHEDSEEDRHSVRNIRPTRSDVVLIPGDKAAAQAPKEAPAAPAESETPTETEAPAKPAPELPPAAPAPELPPFTPTPAVPVNGAETEEPIIPQPAAVESNSADPVDAGTQPPVLVAPEPEPMESVETTPSQGPENHAPVKSTEAADHEAHASEDAFERPVRKNLPVMKSPPMKGLLPPITEGHKSVDHEAHSAEDAFERPVRKNLPVIEKPVAKNLTPAVTEGHKSVDHEAHAAEDAFERPVRKKVPQLKAPEDESTAVADPPAAAESRKPIAAESEEPATVPEPSSDVILGGVTPRIIEEDVESKPAVETEPVKPQVDEDRVTPMAVPEGTRPRGPERITVPERMPPTTPDIPSPPIAPQESEFTVAPRPTLQSAPAPVIMEITGPKQIPVGTQVVLHFKLQNVSNAPVTGIVVSDILPSGLQHRQSPDLEYRVARLEPGEIRETNLTVQCVTRGTITNKAALRADGDVTTEAAIQIEVTGATAGPSAPPPPSESPFTFHHHGPERWLVDSTGQFLMTVTNSSNQTLKNVTITQTYPEGTNLLHATVGHKTDEKSRTVSWTIAEFGPGVSYILETELHSLTRGPATSVARIKIGNTEVAEDKWTSVSYVTMRP